ncbi:MAG: polysaccharide biosynthesis/export family protein [Pseudomonadota bacterium]
MTVRALIMSFLFLCAQACTTTNLERLAEAAPGPYTLDSGDQLRVTVYRLDELTGDYIVSDTGSISLPLLDPIQARGKTVEQLENDIEGRISEKSLIREASVSAQIQKYRPFFIVGEVNRPGEYSYQPNMSVLTALSMAGGQTFRANTDRISITRTVDGQITTGLVSPGSRVLPGDTIRVYEGWF